MSISNELEILTLDPLPQRTMAQARRTVVARARDAHDEKALLEILGLLPTPAAAAGKRCPGCGIRHDRNALGQGRKNHYCSTRCYRLAREQELRDEQAGPVDARAAAAREAAGPAPADGGPS